MRNHPGWMLAKAGREKARRAQVLVEGLPRSVKSRPSSAAPRISSA
jgi:hypothetical protein